MCISNDRHETFVKATLNLYQHHSGNDLVKGRKNTRYLRYSDITNVSLSSCISTAQTMPTAETFDSLLFSVSFNVSNSKISPALLTFKVLKRTDENHSIFQSRTIVLHNRLITNAHGLLRYPSV